jgi:hypothetical protein
VTVLEPEEIAIEVSHSRDIFWLKLTRSVKKMEIGSKEWR